MLAYCTYCSADKHYSETLLPAIQLYNSVRINKVFQAAKKSTTPFLILSGKYGVVSSSEKISYYDHLLTSSEIETHSDLISAQMMSMNITAIEFYTNSIKKDKNLHPYLDCITKACAKASIKLKIIEENFVD
jgi:hypothetical protein